MLRMHIRLFVAVATVMLVGPFVSVANGFQWWVNGAALVGSQGMAFTVQKTIEIKTAKIAVNCTAATSTNGEIANEVELNWEKLKLESCTVPGKPECTVKAGEIPITNAEGFLEINAFVQVIHPGGGVWASFTIEGPTCTIANTYTMSGKIFMRLREAEKAENPKFFVMEPTTSLKIEPNAEAVERFAGELKATAAGMNTTWFDKSAAKRC